MTSLFSPTATPTASQPAITASQPVNLQPVGQDALPPGELTTDAACEFSPSDAKLVANLAAARTYTNASSKSNYQPGVWESARSGADDHQNINSRGF